MPTRPQAWCAPEAHVWQRSAAMVLHLPQADGAAPELVIRVCTRCPLAEVMHLVHTGLQASLRAWEQWWVEEDRVLAGWQHTHVIWDKGKEEQSWI